MSETFGNKIIQAVQAIGSQGVEIRTEETRNGKAYNFGDMRYEVKININPPKWIGMEFVLLGTKLSYAINTDLYNISQPKNITFATSIELEIVNFLNDLAGGHVKVAQSKRGAMLLIPVGTKHVLVKQGSFLYQKSCWLQKKLFNPKLTSGRYLSRLSVSIQMTSLTARTPITRF